jgi:hypothetical protein
VRPGTNQVPCPFPARICASVAAAMPRKALLRRLVPHLAMGLGLGSFCALALIVMDAAHVQAILSNVDTPRLAVLAFVLATSSLFSVATTLTGFLFITMEEN